MLMLILAAIAGVTLAATDTTSYRNKYSLYGLASGSTTVTNAASALFSTNIDTKLYLGDHYTGDYAPAIDSDYGLSFTGQ